MNKKTIILIATGAAGLIIGAAFGASIPVVKTIAAKLKAASAQASS